MANTTFSGPVRSENGFEVIDKNTSTGAITSTMSLKEFTATITVANGATTGKETSIQIPTNFIPLGIGVVVTTAAVNAVNLVDIGTDADTDGYVDGASLALNTTEQLERFLRLQWCTWYVWFCTRCSRISWRRS